MASPSIRSDRAAAGFGRSRVAVACIGCAIMETATLSRPRNASSDFAMPHFALLDVTADIAMLDLVLVNAFFVGDPADGPDGWVLVDAGIHGSAPRFIRAAEERYGRGAR